MTQSTLLERKRKAFIHAKLDTLQKKHGSHSVFVKVADFNCRLDLDEEILNAALIRHFELYVLELKSKPIAELLIMNTYNDLYTKHGNLTKKGNEFMNELLELIAQKTEPIK
ncbi:hypothetical protein [Xenorhabdus bovienii]|uniref:Uncharacterized protein n=1 Tax=Xenorhabdus bovienii str. feltiae Moldova TaxID=1398200 RepID=A0A077NRR6_XENBV|nr:hypothetical protein [Xenorhabdus bovienii]CDH01158.1 hypothetical protein XBFM1_2010005 [Xenorhabdus bovienii str. feltiae Moldova]